MAYNIPKPKHSSKSYLKNRLINYFFLNPVKGTEIVKLVGNFSSN